MTQSNRHRAGGEGVAEGLGVRPRSTSPDLRPVVSKPRRRRCCRHRRQIVGEDNVDREAAGTASEDFSYAEKVRAPTSASQRREKRASAQSGLRFATRHLAPPVAAWSSGN
jgi:hypothetical protein